MPEHVEIIDTQILVFAAHETEQWAVDIYEEILDGERVVYVPRYVLTEFAQVLFRGGGNDERDIVWNTVTALSDTPAAFTSHPNRFRIDVDAARHQAETRALATVCDMQPKDAPIVAIAHRLAELVDVYQPPTHPEFAIPQQPEEFELLQRLKEAGVNSIVSRIVTNENDFVGEDLNDVGLSDVEIETVP
jgi:predicted nucleic acid-binding protein